MLKKHRSFFGRETEKNLLRTFSIIPLYCCIIIYIMHQLKITKLSYQLAVTTYITSLTLDVLNAKAQTQKKLKLGSAYGAFKSLQAMVAFK